VEPIKDFQGQQEFIDEAVRKFEAIQQKLKANSKTEE
jgi:hypothetical protein